MQVPKGSVYDPGFVRALFDEMSATCGLVNLVSSFGFCRRLLGVYPEAFGSCRSAASAFRDAGSEVEVRSFFFGCATGLVGRKTVSQTGRSGGLT